MDTGLPATTSPASNAFARVPRRDLGQWGMDRQKAGSGIGKPICEAATGGR